MQPKLIVAEYENLEVKLLFGMIGLKIASLWMGNSMTRKIRKEWSEGRMDWSG